MYVFYIFSLIFFIIYFFYFFSLIAGKKSSIISSTLRHTHQNEGREKDTSLGTETAESTPERKDMRRTMPTSQSCYEINLASQSPARKSSRPTKIAATEVESGSRNAMAIGAEAIPTFITTGVELMKIINYQRETKDVITSVLTDEEDGIITYWIGYSDGCVHLVQPNATPKLQRTFFANLEHSPVAFLLQSKSSIDNTSNNQQPSQQPQPQQASSQIQNVEAQSFMLAQNLAKSLKKEDDVVWSVSEAGKVSSWDRKSLSQLQEWQLPGLNSPVCSMFFAQIGQDRNDSIAIGRANGNVFIFL